MTERRGKYNAKRVKIDNYTFDSQAEARRYEELAFLKKAGAIMELRVHPRYILQEPFTDNNGKRQRAIHYVADFSYLERSLAGNSALAVVEDVKGHKTAVFRLKEKLFRKRYPYTDLRILEV